MTKFFEIVHKVIQVSALNLQAIDFVHLNRKQITALVFIFFSDGKIQEAISSWCEGKKKKKVSMGVLSDPSFENLGPGLSKSNLDLMPYANIMSLRWYEYSMCTYMDVFIYEC